MSPIEIHPHSSPLILPNGFNETLYPLLKGQTSIDTEQKKVWKVISKANHLPCFHPFVNHNEARHWDANQAEDELQYHSGVRLQRKVFAWHDGEGFDLIIGQNSQTPDGVVSWRVSGSEGLTEFVVGLHLINKNNREEINPAVKARFLEYLDSIVKGMNHFVTTGKPVSKDQFGSVAGFS